MHKNQIQLKLLSKGILRYANTRLMQMTAGQYELERIGAENQRSQSSAASSNRATGSCSI